MADFTLNPSVGGVPSANMPDQTNASRGAIPDKSFGVIAEGLGQVAQTAAGMYNDYNIIKSIRPFVLALILLINPTLIRYRESLAVV
jgi:hypothetical protein